VAPYSVLGTRLSKEGKFEVVTGKPGETEALVDPAGYVCLGSYTWLTLDDALYHTHTHRLPYVSGEQPMKNAGAASGFIYKWLGVDDFPQDVRNGIQRATDAKFYKYDGDKK
jgi:hypothetical protein